MTQLHLIHLPPAPLALPRRRPARSRAPVEFKIQTLRECGDHPVNATTPENIADYWRAHIPQADWFDPCKECLVVILLNTRKRIIGHNLVGLGTVDTILTHPREILRPAVIAAASCFVLVHNHPSGDPTPSEADIRVTRELIRAGQMLKIELLDHFIIAHPAPAESRGWHSLRELGYFYA